MRNILVGISVFVVSLFSISLAPLVFAADFDVALDTNVEITAFDKLVTVDTRLTVTNNVGSETPESISLPVFGRNIKSVLAMYSDDDGLIDASYDEQRDEIFVPLIRSNKGTGNTWSVDVSYSTEAVDELGETHSVVLDGFPNTLGDFEIESEKRTITSDLSLGVGTRIGKISPTSSVGIGVQNLTWDEDRSVDYATGLVFGDVALASAEVETKLENSSILFKNFTVVLAPDNNQQRVYVDNIEPKPRNVRVDVDGNILAEYRVGPFGSVDVTASATILANNFTYDFDSASDKLSEDEKSTLATSLENTTRWPTQNFEDVDAATPDIELIQQIIDKTLEQDLDSFGSDEFAKVVGRNDYFVGALRGYDIPARAIRGKLTNAGQQTSHAWAEVYVGGMGWITVDHMSSSKSFRTADARYVALLTRNIDDSFPPSRINDTTVSYIDGTELPTSEETPVVASRTYMILPGLGIRITSVDTPPGVVVDNTALVIEGDRLTELGSIAPLQTIVSRDPVWGSNALNPTEVKYGVIDAEGEFVEAARVESTVSWKPFIALVVAGVLGVAGFFIWKNRKPSNKPRKPKKPKKFGRKRKASPNSHVAVQNRQNATVPSKPAPREVPARPKPAPRPARKPITKPAPKPTKPSPSPYKSSSKPPTPRRKKPPTLIQ